MNRPFWADELSHDARVTSNPAGRSPVCNSWSSAGLWKTADRCGTAAGEGWKAPAHWHRTPTRQHRACGHAGVAQAVAHRLQGVGLRGHCLVQSHFAMDAHSDHQLVKYPHAGRHGNSHLCGSCSQPVPQSRSGVTERFRRHSCAGAEFSSEARSPVLIDGCPPSHSIGGHCRHSECRPTFQQETSPRSLEQVSSEAAKGARADDACAASRPGLCWIAPGSCLSRMNAWSTLFSRNEGQVGFLRRP